MKLLGFNFIKMNVEKKKEIKGKVEIKPDIDIKQVNEVESNFFGAKNKLIGLNFVYSLDYKPDYAWIELSGNILLDVGDENLIKEIIKKWEKKQLPDEFQLKLFNLILKKCSLKALQLEDELNIPLHINMPFLSKKE